MPTNGSKKRPGEPRAIESMYVAIAGDRNGDQGIVGRVLPGGGGLPLVFTRADMLDTIGEFLSDMATRTGETIEVVEFTRGRTVRTYP